MASTKSFLKSCLSTLSKNRPISSALTDDLTIVTGPPGTGKSQVVTDLLVNIAWQGKKRFIRQQKTTKPSMSVETRVNNLGRRPVMLRIGGNQYAYRLAELIADLLAYTTDQTDREEYNRYAALYRDGISAYLEIKSEKEKAVALRNQVDHIEQHICTLRGKWNDWFGKVTEDEVDTFSHAFQRIRNKL